MHIARHKTHPFRSVSVFTESFIVALKFYNTECTWMTLISIQHIFPGFSTQLISILIQMSLLCKSLKNCSILRSKAQLLGLN